MPTENELKYVLRTDFEKKLHDYHDVAMGKIFEILFISQGYLLSDKNSAIRIRSTNSHKFKLCYKHKVAHRLIEIEKNICQRDFDELWEFCDCKVKKIRYNIVSQKSFDPVTEMFGGVVQQYWSVDAYKDEEDKTYFLLAEHEMPEQQKEPIYIPSIITDGLLFSVPQSDSGFSAKKLSDTKYADKLYSKLLKKFGD